MQTHNFLRVNGGTNSSSNSRHEVSTSMQTRFADFPHRPSLTLSQTSLRGDASPGEMTHLECTRLHRKLCPLTHHRPHTIEGPVPIDQLDTFVLNCFEFNYTLYCPLALNRFDCKMMSHTHTQTPFSVLCITRPKLLLRLSLEHKLHWLHWPRATIARSGCSADWQSESPACCP